MLNELIFFTIKKTGKKNKYQKTNFNDFRKLRNIIC